MILKRYEEFREARDEIRAIMSDAINNVPYSLEIFELAQQRYELAKFNLKR